MSKYLINGRFYSRKMTGVDRFASEILKQLDGMTKPGEFELALPKNTINLPVFKNIRVSCVGKNTGNLWEQLDYCFYAYKNNTKAINLCNTAPLLKPDVVVIYDTKINDHPEFFNRKFVIWYRIQFANSFKNAKLIITDSYSAKKDILRNYPETDPNKIYVVYPSWEHMSDIKYDEQALLKYGLCKKQYYFSLGSIEPNKNLKWIIETAARNQDEVFVIAGKIDEHVYKPNDRQDIPENVKLIGYISDEEVKTLMRDCKAFVFPSFEEGFGLPPVEALSAGADSLIVSDIPVMHELFDDHAIYIDPENSDFCIKRNNEIDALTREEILKKFSWKESAEKLYSAIVDTFERK